MAKAKRKYSETGNPDDITSYDYVKSILYKKKLPVTKRYNHHYINMVLALDPTNAIHADMAGRKGLTGSHHYNHMMIVVDKRKVPMYDVQTNESKEVRTAKGLLADKLEISRREVENYINDLGVQYLDEFIREYSDEIKELIKKKKYV